MAVETKQVRMGEHFTEDALPRVAEIFDQLREGDPFLAERGRYIDLYKGQVQVKPNTTTWVLFVAKDYQGEFARKAAIVVYNKYHYSGEQRVETKIEEKSNGAKTMKIKTTYHHLGGKSKEVESATFVNEGNGWKTESVSEVYIKGNEESHLTHLTPKHVIAGTVLGYAWEVIEASREQLRSKIVGAIIHERGVERTIVELLG